MKKQVTIHVFDEEIDDEVPNNPEDFLNYFREKLDLIPKEYRDISTIELDASLSYSDARLNLTISYRREETDEEERVRLKREKDRADFIENQELCQLEKLRNKYGI